MQEITKVQRLTQAVQLTAALMIAVRAGIRLRAEVERIVHEEVEYEQAPGQPPLFDSTGLAALVKRMQDSISENLRKAAREAEGRD
jgi:hypothetical protein